jgi:HEAT repeat protein
VDEFYTLDNHEGIQLISYFKDLNFGSTAIFWLGFLSGVLVAWIFSRLIIYIPAVIRDLRKKIGGVRENFSISSEVRLRTDIYRYAQKQHIASTLFSLDEIAIIPKVLTPLMQAPQLIEIPPTDSVSLTIPYIPDWPEMAAVYNGSTMTLIEALQGGANILLAGHPGCGKSFALAWLASCMARNAAGLGTLGDILPIYIQATEVLHQLHLVEKDENNSDDATTGDASHGSPQSISNVRIAENPIEILINSIMIYTTPLTATRLSGIIHSALEKQRALLIIDRLDELPPHQAKAITAFIISMQQKYPKLRFVVATSYDNLAGLPAIGFRVLGMAGWNDYDRAAFLEQWSRQWTKWITPLEKNQYKKINIDYLNSWLKVNNTTLKPLEYALKVWAAFSGDIVGSDGPSAIETHIRRLIHDVPKSRSGLERFAFQLLSKAATSSDIKESERFMSDLDAEEESPESETNHSTAPDQSQPTQSTSIKGISGVETLIDNGLLISYPGSHFGFSHPIYYGYLAASALSNAPDAIKQLQNQPSWTVRTLAMYYLARVGDVTPLINNLLQDDDILHTNHLLISRWLQIAPKNRAWRSTILRTLTSILQKEKDTYCLAAKIISAMAFSGDNGISIYFRQLLKSDHPVLKQLAALGCGIIGDKKSIEDLNSLLQDQSPSLRRAASLALAAIADKVSLEILASSLLNGDEQMRRCAAEALANNPKEGHPALQEGSSMDDLMVRRAVVFGLMRINLPWATKIVENLQLEDNEWVVRNAAIQAFDELKRKKEYAPKPSVDLTESTWLIEYAEKNGTTVAPGKPAEDLAIKALANGTHDEIINVLQHIVERCDAEKSEFVYSAYINNTGEIKDFAYYVLWLMMIAGIKIPLTVKYDIK